MQTRKCHADADVDADADANADANRIHTKNNKSPSPSVGDININQIHQRVLKTLTFVDARGSTIALCELCSGELKSNNILTGND